MASRISATWFHNSKHLSEQELLKPSTACIFCGNTDLNSVETLQHNPDVSLIKCQHCNAISPSRIPTDNALKTYYESYYKHNNEDENITFDVPNRLSRHIYSHFDVASSNPIINILDFGGGDGTISKIIASNIIQNKKRVCLTIVDYNAPPESEEGDLSIRCYSHLYEIVKGKFDIIIASAVIEHIPEPMPIMKTLLELLAPNGLMYIRTPAVLPLISLTSKFGFKMDFTFPGHLHDLGQKFWDNFLNLLPDQNEFELIRSQPSIVETTFSKHFLRTLAAYVLKAPWRIFDDNWGFVGGWEVFIRRKKLVGR